jgi:mono/diheme cytochrome c family protein
MRASSALHAVFVAASIAGALAAVSVAGVGAQPGRPAGEPAERAVTPVAGPSWLSHLNTKYRDTSLGRGAGRYGPAPNNVPPAAADATVQITPHPVALTGADLYRLNCQACHRAEGTGAKGEIKSVVDLIQGSSVAMVSRQLQPGGKAPSAAATAQARQARADLYRRIEKGGERMPPLAHLEKAEVDVLYAYLTQLAGNPDAQRLSARTVSWGRLGEHVVKGTCHICHDAAGPRPPRDAMLQGAIPSMSVLLADNPRVLFIRKVRSGAPVSVDGLSFHYRGRMPVFHYLRDEELAAAYDFLVAYPPQAAAVGQP